MENKYPYSCDVKVSFPTAQQAVIAMKVMDVDKEVGNRVRKFLSIDPDNQRTLLIAFQAVDAKSIRVSISSFYDYLTVSLKCIQEFDLGGGEGEVVSGNTDAGE